jgi:hypothetical protein
MMENKRVIDLQLDELEDRISAINTALLKSVLSNFHKSEELVSRKQVKERLGIAYSTLDDYTKKGILKSYQLGHRIFYKWHEVINAAHKIERS